MITQVRRTVILYMGGIKFRLVERRCAVPLGFRAKGEDPALVLSSSDINRDFQDTEVAPTSCDTTQSVPTHLLSALLLAGTAKWSSQTIPSVPKWRKV